MFPMTRIVYSIASDGLIFKWLAKILPKFQTPGLATICTGLITATLATIFDLDQLIEMTSIGTLLSYSIVSACVIVLRYTLSQFVLLDGPTGLYLPPNLKWSLFSKRYKPARVSIDENEDNEDIIEHGTLIQRILSPTTCSKATSKLVNITTLIAGR